MSDSLRFQEGLLVPFIFKPEAYFCLNIVLQSSFRHDSTLASLSSHKDQHYSQLMHHDSKTGVDV